MKGILRRLRARPLLWLWVALGALVPIQVGVVVTGRDPKPRPPAHAAPSPPAVAPSYAVRTEEPRPASPSHAPSESEQNKRMAVFGGLGAWVDVYDFDNRKPAESVAEMARHGVRTLYVQTGRYNTKRPIAVRAGHWLEAGHAGGLKVVGWYLPSYKNLAHDVRRTIAIARYVSPAGERFDGLGIDVESRAEVRDVLTWNTRVALHAARVRVGVGNRYPLAAITPPPLGMSVLPYRWVGFPWRALAREADVLMLMSYWSFRDDCTTVPAHCATGYTTGNVRTARRLAGRSIPIHVIGGVGDSITRAQLADFVRAARGVRAFGGSLYDYDTTKPSWWTLLRPLRSLG